MLESKYLVQDDSWELYPTASSLEKVAFYPGSLQDTCSYARELNRAIPPDKLLYRILTATRKNFRQDPPKEIYLDDKDRALMFQMYYLEQDTLALLQAESNLNFNIELREKRLWFLDPPHQKLMSGFFDRLLVDSFSHTGVIFKYHFDSQAPIPTQKDIELGLLALIASEALKLRSVLVMTLWALDESVSGMRWYTPEQFQTLSNELQLFLKQFLAWNSKISALDP